MGTLDLLPLVWQVLATAAAVLVAWRAKKILSKQKIPLPPGPPADPIIGHIRLIPSEGQDIYFYELGQTYGDVVQLRIMGKSIIILNSVEAAVDLLDKRSSIYGDRPKLPVFELLGIADTLVFREYGKYFRLQRRMVQQYFTTRKRQEHRPIQTREARVLAQNFLRRPEDWLDSLVQFTATIIIQICYGHQIVSNDDPYLKIAEECCRIAKEVGPPSTTPVDLFPILRYFPSWFPGTHYANFARKSSAAFRKLREFPYHQMLDKIAKGTARPSFLLTQLETLDQKESDAKTKIDLIQTVSTILYVAGADTTSASLAFFVLAMVLYPECQAKAQEEIDAVVGSDRLPDFHDRKSLPYLECLVQETLRWNHSAPTGIPHRLMEDDIYRGMLIPKGSVVIANVRGMTLNESVYYEPWKFDPARYLARPAGRGEPFSASHFGFGRRICPGRHLADDSLWIAISTTLATVKFSKALDENGKEINPDATPVAAGISNQPKPFRCRLEARTKVALELLVQTADI
ncbi:O-methylsterigmatocystin oxidoreductase [Termitomyces sp. T112]|nr:O-methylsterigmatocystin oxidoreductase [Termitomyces sp. T112]